MEEPDLVERRLGARNEDSRFGIGWRLGRVDGGGGRSRRNRPLPPEHGELLDVSVTGASVLAQSADDLTVGSEVVVAVRGVAGKVTIRRIDRQANSARSIYGVEFAESHWALAELDHDLPGGTASAAPATDDVSTTTAGARSQRT